MWAHVGVGPSLRALLFLAAHVQSCMCYETMPNVRMNVAVLFPQGVQETIHLQLTASSMSTKETPYTLNERILDLGWVCRSLNLSGGFLTGADDTEI